jgi:hypothetical protein
MRAHSEREDILIFTLEAAKGIHRGRKRGSKREHVLITENAHKENTF